MARDKLEELSRDLPDREREELLRKLGGSKPAEGGEPVRPVELPAEERARLVEEDMRGLTWFARLVLWLERLITGKDAKTVFVRARVRALKARIRQVNPALTGFESRDLRPRFAQIVYEVFYRVVQVAELCRAVTKDAQLQDAAFTALFEGSVPNAKKDIDDLLPQAEMERIIAQKGSVDEVRKQLLRSLQDYLKSIPRDAIAAIERQLEPLYNLERLVCFSYGSLFRYFNYEIREPLEQRYPPFDAAPAMLLVGHMERLLYGVSLVREIPEEWSPPEELVKLYLLRSPAGAAAPGAAAPDAAAPEAAAVTAEARRIREAVTEVVAAAQSLGTRIPLLDMIRYFRGDPYYRLKFTPPSVDVLTHYTQSLRARILEKLREKTDSIKKQAIERRIEEFMRGPLPALGYYNGAPDFDFRKLGMPYFAHTRSLALLSAYLDRIYRSYVHEVVQLANSTVLTANKLVQNRLMQSDSQVEDILPRISALDAALAPNEEEGKALLSFRHDLSSDPAQQRFFKSFIADKDRQARTLVEKAQVHLAEVVRVLDETINSPTESLKALLRTTQLLRGKAQTLGVLLSSRRDNVREFLDLLEQTASYEKGA